MEFCHNLDGMLQGHLTQLATYLLGGANMACHQVYNHIVHTHIYIYIIYIYYVYVYNKIYRIYRTPSVKIKKVAEGWDMFCDDPEL